MAVVKADDDVLEEPPACGVDNQKCKQMNAKADDDALKEAAAFFSRGQGRVKAAWGKGDKKERADC